MFTTKELEFIKEKIQVKNISRKSIYVKMIKMNLKYLEICSRCAGTGRYSWNTIDSDMCYGCKGTGLNPKMKKNIFLDYLNTKMFDEELRQYNESKIENKKTEEEKIEEEKEINLLNKATDKQINYLKVLLRTKCKHISFKGNLNGKIEEHENDVWYIGKKEASKAIEQLINGEWC